MYEPTDPMKKEAASAGFYTSGSEGAGTWGKHPRIQLLTIRDLLNGKKIDMPPMTGSLTFRRAQRQSRYAETSSLFNRE
jgi:hypothetical protein